MFRSGALSSAVEGRARHVKTEAIAIEGDRALEIGDDRAEEVARPDDEPGASARARRGLSDRDGRECRCCVVDPQPKSPEPV
jgi:hypothetical protein